MAMHKANKNCRRCKGTGEVADPLADPATSFGVLECWCVINNRTPAEQRRKDKALAQARRRLHG